MGAICEPSRVRKQEDGRVKDMGTRTRIACILAFVCVPALVYAQAPTPPENARAVWVRPAQTQASWVDARQNTFEPGPASILAAGDGIVLYQDIDGSIRVTNQAFEILGQIVVPEGTTWLGLDGDNRIFAYDGHQVFAAQSWQDAQAMSGYFGVLAAENATAIDHAGPEFVIADAQTLLIANLETGSSRRLVLDDFFDATKRLAMTPEAVLAADIAAEAAAKRGKKKADPVKAEAPLAADKSLSDVEVLGLWWRHDGVGILRARKLLSVQSFVTRDHGRSWSTIELPAQLIHTAGWIWDGQDRVLDAKGERFVRVCGPTLKVAARFAMSSSPVLAPELALAWHLPPSPQAPDLEVSNVVENVENAENAPAPVAEACVPVDAIADWSSFQAAPELGYDAAEELGTRMGIAGIAPYGRQLRPGGVLEPMELPAACIPEYLSSRRGLGVLICAPGQDEGESTIYVRTADSPWVLESRFSTEHFRQPSLKSSPDGTLVLVGDCGISVVENTDLVIEIEGQEAPVASVPKEVVVCYAAVRNNGEIGQMDIWRVERVMGAGPSDFMVAGDGQVLASIQEQGGLRRLELLTPERTQTLVSAYDSTVYDGIALTPEGCLRLYDEPVSGTGAVEPSADMPIEGPRLLSTTGGLATYDCASSQQIAEHLGSPIELDSPNVGDARYGMRVGGGAFFAGAGVMTWLMRAEAVFPLYGGQYEITAMFRLAGGNSSSSLGYLGMVSARWRYDGLEYFDFAAGAGLGFGSMCGYDKSADKGALDDDPTTAVSGYQKCSTLSMRYHIGGVAAYKFAKNWKLYIAADLIGGASWGGDVSGGLEIRF